MNGIAPGGLFWSLDKSLAMPALPLDRFGVNRGRCYKHRPLCHVLIRIPMPYRGYYFRALKTTVTVSARLALFNGLKLLSG